MAQNSIIHIKNAIKTVMKAFIVFLSAEADVSAGISFISFSWALLLAARYFPF